MTDQTVTCDTVTRTIDEYLDGTAGAPARAAIDAHVASCPSCAALVADVRTIRRAARALGPMTPPARVWTAIQSQVSPERLVASSGGARADGSPRRLATWTWRESLAAAAMLTLVVSGLTWVGARLHDQPARLAVTTPEGAGGGAGVGGELDEFRAAEAEYADAIASLEEVTATSDPRMLDAVTGATLQSTLDDVETVIGDARIALAQEPGDPRSQENLLDALGSKVALLQQTVALIDEVDATEGLKQ